MAFYTLPAKLISYLFHPLFLPTAGLCLVFNMPGAELWLPSPEMEMFLYAMTFLATCLLPLLNALFLLRYRMISSLEMETKEERRIPYLAAAIFYSAQSWFLMNTEVPVLIKALMFGATLLVVCVLLINLFWKISAHMTGIGGLCGIMICISYRLQLNLHVILIALFLLAGIIAWSRLKLGAHNPAQVYAGFLVGVFAELILFLPL